MVGFLRTHDKDRLCLGPADLSLAEALFQNPGCVFLLISPSGTNGGFFFWDTLRYHFFADALRSTT